MLSIGSSCSDNDKGYIKVNEVSPWCILGFDTQDREPLERIAMIKELGLSKYGFNKGKGDLSRMVEEFQLADQNGIEFPSIFLWLNAKRDSIGKLSAANQELLGNLYKVNGKPTIWVSFSDNFFKDRNHEESVLYCVEMIKSIKSEADKLKCKVALYNHHGWFGDPRHQVEILEMLDDESITMVYNFHHAQEYVDDFPAIVKLIMPHLSYVNLNGVKKEGPQIITIGKGDHELDMIRELKVVGYDGPWGILGHIKTEDVRVVLERNLQGLKEVNASLQ